MGGPLDVRWIHGSPDCAADANPPLQVHSFDADTYILRQNKCHNFEAPFLYLLFGGDKALLLDTGADPGPGRQLPLRDVVRAIIARRAGTRGRPAQLVVAHTHSHGDHVFGDGQFASDPDATVVPLDLQGVRDFFGLRDWPEGQANLDLGGRRLSVIPTPGHEPTHVVIYDPVTEILLTGDTLYPGFLFVPDWAAYRRSVGRLVRFAADHSVRYVLGAHVEMTRTPGVPYPYGTTYQPEEHVLQLLPGRLADLHTTVERLGDVPARTVRDDFILEPRGT
jgi:glyoxylase-like metal-dependent hydrolase (beta-lactamase superfamily II)